MLYRLGFNHCIDLIKRTCGALSFFLGGGGGGAGEFNEGCL